MEKYIVFMLSLPVVFMIHDFEEIIGFRPWMLHNQHDMEKRFPRIARRIVPHILGISTSAFAVGVACMFLIVSVCSFCAVIWDIPQLWMGVFMAYSIHIVVHIFQWMAFRKYVPVVITSLLSIPYCFYGIRIIFENFDTIQIIIWSGLGLAVMSFTLPVIHGFIGKLHGLNEK